MKNLKITAFEELNMYTEKEGKDRVELAALNMTGWGYCEKEALEKLCEAMLELWPHDSVTLDVTYSISNNQGKMIGVAGFRASKANEGNRLVLQQQSPATGA